MRPPTQLQLNELWQELFDKDDPIALFMRELSDAYSDEFFIHELSISNDEPFGSDMAREEVLKEVDGMINFVCEVKRTSKAVAPFYSFIHPASNEETLKVLVFARRSV